VFSLLGFARTFRFAFLRIGFDFLRIDLRICKVHLVAMHCNMHITHTTHTTHTISGRRKAGGGVTNKVTPHPSLGWSSKAMKRGDLWLIPVCVFALGALRS